MTPKECDNRRQRDITFVSSHPSSLWTKEILTDLVFLKKQEKKEEVVKWFFLLYVCFVFLSKWWIHVYLLCWFAFMRLDFCIVLHCVELYCIVLYCIVLYRIVVFYTNLFNCIEFSVFESEEFFSFAALWLFFYLNAL